MIIILNPGRGAFLEKLTTSQILKKDPAFYVTRMLITNILFTRIRH
jgi:hypothetical protein